MNIQDILGYSNVADHLSDEELATISGVVIEHYDTDMESRAGWETAYRNWLAMTGQEVEAKSQPWQGAANIKYPLMTQAALNFNARVVPALMPNNKPVGIGVVGPDLGGEKAIIAQAVSNHMNYQTTVEMEEWEEEFDSLLMAISISGIEYKKTYFDPILNRNVSRHITPLNLVVNYYADTLENSRKTEVHRWTKNKIMESIAGGYFVDVDWETHPTPTTGQESEVQKANAKRVGMQEPSSADSATPYVVLEYHGWYDLDGDGYEEPYIITMLKDSRQILQIIPRFGEESVVANEGELVSITPYESYTKYGFIPNPDGSFYHIGFGNILYPINAVVNTAINMMLDAGASSIMNSGFVGRGLKIRGGMFSMAPNTWLTVNSTGDDIRKSFVPMPTKEPSSVLLSLMQYMVEAGEKLASTTDIFSGQMPGQNTKTGVTQAVREEGQKIFTAIYKRIRNSLRKELDKIAELNYLVLSAGEAGEATLIAKSAAVFNVNAEMYDRTLLNIQPSADPNMAVKQEKIEKDTSVLALVQQLGMGNVTAAARNLMRTMEVENIDAILPEDAAPPANPEVQMETAELELKSSQADFDAAMATREMELKEWIAKTEAQLGMLKLTADADKNSREYGVALATLEKDIEAAKEAMNDRREAASAANANKGPVEQLETAPNDTVV